MYIFLLILIGHFLVGFISGLYVISILALRESTSDVHWWNRIMKSLRSEDPVYRSVLLGGILIGYICIIGLIQGHLNTNKK